MTQNFINCPFKLMASDKMDLGFIYFFKINSIKMKMFFCLWGLNIKMNSS